MLACDSFVATLSFTIVMEIRETAADSNSRQYIVTDDSFK